MALWQTPIGGGDLHHFGRRSVLAERLDRDARNRARTLRRTWRRGGMRGEMACYAPQLRLFDDETVITLQVAYRQRSTPAVDAVEVTEKIRLAVGGGRQSVVRARQVLARGWAHRIGGNDDDEPVSLF